MLHLLLELFIKGLLSLKMIWDETSIISRRSKAYTCSWDNLNKPQRFINYKPNSIHEHIDLTISISLKQVIYY